MKTVKIYGVGNDRVVIKGTSSGDGTFPAFNHLGGYLNGCVDLVSSEGTMRVFCLFCDGLWVFTASPVGGAPYSRAMWDIHHSWFEDNEYSRTMFIECPDDVVAVFFSGG